MKNTHSKTDSGQLPQLQGQRKNSSGTQREKSNNFQGGIIRRQGVCNIYAVPKQFSAVEGAQAWEPGCHSSKLAQPFMCVYTHRAKRSEVRSERRAGPQSLGEASLR